MVSKSCCDNKSQSLPEKAKSAPSDLTHDNNSCCSTTPEHVETTHNTCCDKDNKKADWFLRICLIFGTFFYIVGLGSNTHDSWLDILSHSVVELFHSMWWSVLLAILFVGALSKTPRHFVLSVLGKGGTFKGLLRATCAGVLLDLCNHGILMVGMELRKKGASLGQTMAFIIASPWNSLSLTLILIALVGLPWTLAFIGLSMLLALTSGWVFDRLEANAYLPSNQYEAHIPENFQFWHEAKLVLASIQWNSALASDIFSRGLSGSMIVLRWLLFGILLASAIRAFVTLEDFQTYFGPTLIGLTATLVAATIIEVCSEGSAPIAGDLLSRANAPGNSFAFLMAGAATDYTEVMVIKETTQSWKTALFLPLITVPQVFAIAVLLNHLYA